MYKVVGLFGSCGEDQWRVYVEKELRKNGIEFFNPVVPDWSPEFLDVEADHLDNDEVILLAITNGTESFGSLAETGWAMASCMATGRQLVLVIQPFGDNPKSDANRARELVKAHAQKMGLKVYDSIEEATREVIRLMGRN